MLNEIVSEFISRLPTIALTLFGAGIAYWFALQEYYKKLRTDGRAIVSTYIATIGITKDSLKELQGYEDFIDLTLTSIPPEAVYDFREEDWFSVHNALCSDLGKLIYLDEAKGQEAIISISSFFHEFKFSRELFAYLISAQKTAAILHQQDATSSDYLAAREHVVERAKELDVRLKALIEKGNGTIEKLGELVNIDVSKMA